jgi:hypothetical protein
MTSRPILFSGPLVRAILAGEKTETRRLVTMSTSTSYDVEQAERRWPSGELRKAGWSTLLDDSGRTYVAPRVMPGDTLWVREAWRTSAEFNDVKPSDVPAGSPVSYEADGQSIGVAPRWGKGRPSIFLPTWAGRITLRVTDVAVERLQAITDEGAKAEGITDNSMEAFALGMPSGHYRNRFALLWDSINGKRPGASWADDPWVWVIKFQRLEPGEEK